MKFPISRTDLYKELADLGYKESTRIDSPNQVLLTENRGIVRNTITLKGNGITAMAGLTNQNPSIVIKNPTEVVTYNTTYAKTSSLMLDTGLVEDTKLDQYIAASGIDKNLFIDTSLYSIEVTSEGSIKVNFTDIFDEGLILLPLVDGKAYQLDQLDKLGAATDPVLRFATGKSFTKANVLANRKLVPGKTNTYFLPLVLKVTAVGEFPNFTVNAVEPNQSLVNYLTLGPNEISNAALTVGWLGVNAITDSQFRPSLASPLNVDLSIRQFKVPTMPLSYASVAIIDALKVNMANATEVISYNDYTSTLTDASGESRTINIVYNEDYDKTKKQVLQVYTLPITDASALSETAMTGDFDVLRVNNISYKASELIDRIIEDSGKFYIGFPLSITDMPITTNFSLNVGGLNNPNTEWVETSWVTVVTQIIPQELVIPVTKLANKFVKKLSDVDGGFKSGIKHMRVEFDVPANQEFAYGYSDKTNLTILDESVDGLFEVVKPVSTVAIVDQTLTDGTVIKNMTDKVATLRLYIQVPMTSVNQSIGSNYLIESQTTAGAVFDPANSKIIANGDYIFLKSQTANTTIDTLGYSHRYQRLIGKDQAIQFKYNSVMAQSVSFGNAGPLDHTDVTNFQSSVVSANQTKVLMTSDGYVYKIDETGFNQVDRVDLREGVYIEAAIDSEGTGLIITQYQYENDDPTDNRTILSVSNLPEILGDVVSTYTLHVSAFGLVKDTQVFLTDIYDIVHEVDCTGAIDYAGIITLDDDVSGTVDNDIVFDSNAGFIGALHENGFDVTELSTWTPPVPPTPKVFAPRVSLPVVDTTLLSKDSMPEELSVVLTDANGNEFRYGGYINEVMDSCKDKGILIRFMAGHLQLGTVPDLEYMNVKVTLQNLQVIPTPNDDWIYENWINETLVIADDFRSFEVNLGWKPLDEFWCHSQPKWEGNNGVPGDTVLFPDIDFTITGTLRMRSATIATDFTESCAWNTQHNLDCKKFSQLEEAITYLNGIYLDEGLPGKFGSFNGSTVWQTSAADNNVCKKEDFTLIAIRWTENSVEFGYAIPEPIMAM